MLQLSYQYPHGTRPKPCRPFGSNLMGRGPMQDATTQKVDFSAKPYCRREPFGDPRMPFPDTPMEGKYQKPRVHHDAHPTTVLERDATVPLQAGPRHSCRTRTRKALRPLSP